MDVSVVLKTRVGMNNKIRYFKFRLPWNRNLTDAQGPSLSLRRAAPRPAADRTWHVAGSGSKSEVVGCVGTWSAGFAVVGLVEHGFSIHVL